MILKSELKQVPVEQRVPGKWYGAADDLDGQLVFMVCHKDGRRDTSETPWAYWFEIPESMLPVREVQVMPDKFTLDLNEWSYSYSDTVILLYRKKIRPEITIQSGSKQEQIEMLEKKLAELKQS